MADAAFEKAAEDVKNLKTKPSDNELLQVYAFYKQAVVGDNNTDKPGLLAIREKAKWNAWNEKKGLSSEEAKQKYIEYVATLIEKYGLA